MDAIKIIRDKAELEGSCYFEFLPGKYDGACWNDNSIFLSEETWGFIEPLVQASEPRYDHYAFVDVPKSTWSAITAELRMLAAQIREASAPDALPPAVDWFWRQTRDELVSDFTSNRDALASLFEEFAGWVEEQLRSHEFVAILGI